MSNIPSSVVLQTVEKLGTTWRLGELGELRFIMLGDPEEFTVQALDHKQVGQQTYKDSYSRCRERTSMRVCRGSPG